MQPRRKWLYVLGIVLVIFIALYILLLLKPIWAPILKILLMSFIPFFIGGFITYLLHPLVERLHQRGLHRGIAIMIIYLVFFGSICYGIYLGVPLLIEQLKDLSDHLPEFAAQYRNWVEDLRHSTSRWPDGIQDQMDKRIDSFEILLNQYLAKVISSIMKLLNFIFVLAIIPFISFYLLKDMETIKKTAWYFTPKKWRKQAKSFLKDVDESIGGYIRGQLLVCFLIGVISTIAFWLLNIKYPILLGLIIGITNVIPYFGPIIGAIPAAVIAVTISAKHLLYVLVIMFILQFIEGNILSPLIVGKSLHLHPIFIIFALILGEEIGGILGLILAVPVLAIVKVAIIHAKQHFITNRSSNH
ncbi:AI-2E family transporter [Bacillus sp. FJAT-49736]|uniref:AI-2E family transporter n=1 Tax=Bacillus sp. FJAT-49736 TaxID=2833582 RepID=UPI001BC952A5|nr:AI-2E family transporter [Bacillus sp. FJAT-49736]MBS4173639.1 AI-2E family transporter [Bacillus sp. FJAT-49736]